MSRRRLLARRSVSEWSIRVMLAGMMLLGAGISIPRTLAYNLREDDVERAHALAPGDGRITGLLSAKLTMDPTSTPTTRAMADRLARDALRHAPLAVNALSSLGINAQIRGDTAAARRMFAVAESLSRRDVTTQLWAIEDSVARNDIPAALTHYDTALRVSGAAPDLLFPVLASAIENIAVRRALVKTLLARPAWGAQFIDHVAASGPNPGVSAILFEELRRAGVSISDTAEAGVIEKLIGANDFDRAWAHYASLHAGSDPRRSRDPKFDNFTDRPTPFDWSLLNGAGVTASFQRSRTGNILDIAAPPSVGGPVAQQVQLLPAGRYRLTGHSDGIDQAAGSLPYWLLSCRDGHELGRVDIPKSTQFGGTFTGILTVSADCPVQTLALIVRPSDVTTGVTGQIDRVELVPGN